MNNKEKLFEDFSPISKEQWKEKIVQDLKGADYDKKLIWNTIEEFPVSPIYTKEDLENLDYLCFEPGQFPFIRGYNKEDNQWLIRQDFCIHDPKETNEKILKAIEGGVRSIGLFNENIHGCPYNEAFSNAESFSDLFHNIDLEKININFSGTTNSAAFLTLLDEYAENNKIEKSAINGCIGYDPIGYFIMNGKFHDNEDMIFERGKSISELTHRIMPGMRIFSINGRYFHNAGSSVSQELGYGLSVGVEYIHQLTTRGLKIDDFSHQLQFNFAVGSNYFLELAKFRAARLLWSKILEANEPSHESSINMFIHAETSSWNKTIYDPYVNLLRTTTESISSVLGGVDSLTILPFDKAYQNTTDFSERLARNQQLILKEEAYFEKVIDPAAGSYYIENLTNSIAQQAWSLFLNIEENGGFSEAFKKGIIQEQIKATAQKRDMNIATKKEIFLGTNQYANINEKMSITIDPEIYQPSKEKPSPDVEPIKFYRGTMGFEELRLRTENHKSTPEVFLLTQGNLTMRKARASFASNFFSCAGYKVIDNHGFDTVHEGINAAAESKAEIVVLCSSDDEYMQIAPEVIKQLDGKTEIVLAGFPKEHVEKLKGIGIKHFIHIKSNVLETLQNFHQILDIK